MRYIFLVRPLHNHDGRPLNLLHFVTGFSRGAYTARVLAAMLQKVLYNSLFFIPYQSLTL
jgi:uncharacterized protein (DUF2235 family)